ncbi:PucR family transcriptional regulator, partial [Actinomadura scrupuli]|uniref:PucR family transcriptional regulator n=1 Tax=Actinomadura scrupuli TaxID=559629 RepID=UPI003D98888E
PCRVACVALAGPWRGECRLSPAVSANVLMDLEGSEPFLLVPDPERAGCEEMLVRALGGSGFVIGPVVEVAEAGLSLRLARQTLALCRRGIIACDPPVRSADHLPTLLMFSDEGLLDLMSRGVYAPLARLIPTRRQRLTETLLAYLDNGSVPEIATRLRIHPQTARYRLGRLQDLYGDRLQDPDWCFHMHLVLRARALLDRETTTPGPAPSPPPPPATNHRGPPREK